MRGKETEELKKILQGTHHSQFGQFVKTHKDSMVEDFDTFNVYIKNLFQSKGITQQTVFIRADIPERYGYKLLSGEKKTKQRDVILRICYAGELTLEETQKALRIYGLPELYLKIPRDALLMIMFNERPGNILDINAILKENEMEPLRTSGVQN